MTAALTLWQPHASDIAEGRKRFETRAMRLGALVGQRLIVHAGKRLDPAELYRGHEHSDYPFGAIIATCTVRAALPIGGSYSFSTGIVEGEAPDFAGDDVIVLHPDLGHGPRLVVDRARGGVEDVSDQLPFGDWTAGRWALELTDVADVQARCPRCWGRPAESSERTEGGSSSCRHCNRTRTFNFQRDRGTPCSCEAARRERCETCLGVGHVAEPIPARGMPGVWQWP